METGRWSRIADLFHQAADLPRDDRPAFLTQACGADEELRREVELLLAADTPQDTPIRDAIVQAVAQLSPESPEAFDLIGTRIGRYTITCLIGRGGMGVVYQAVREDDFHLQVAVKLLKRGTDTESALGRFRAERQILAGLQHPNIAHVIDGGATEAGLPYFVMEYVDGTPLLEYAAPLTIRQRLELFRLVCAAVQYAHQKQIVHRDIKPANILVTAEGIPKLLDFGIAKLLAPAAEGATALTMTGVRLMTPDYASPEQVRGEPVTTATDVYSLGAVLYELLTGERAHRIQTYSMTEIEKEICFRDPTKPSAVTKDLDPDLDNIVLKALRMEPEQRYASVQELSDDLDRFSKDLPVWARRESWTYRGRKFLKRNRPLMTASAVTAVLTLAAIGVAGAFWFGRTGRNSQSARDDRSIAVLPFEDLSLEKNQQYFSEGLAEELLDWLSKIPGLRVAARTSSFTLAGKKEDPRVIGQKLHVANLLEGSVRKQGNIARINIKLIQASDGSYVWTQRYDEDLRDILAVQEGIARAVTGVLNVRLGAKARRFAKSANPEAYNAYLQGRYFFGIRNRENLIKAVDFFEQATGLDSSYAPAWAWLGESYINQAGSAYLRPVEESYRMGRQAVERALALDSNLADAHVAMGRIHMLGDWDWAGANASFERARALEPGNVRDLGSFALLYRIMGRLDEAIALYRRILAVDPLNAGAFHNSGIAYYYAGQYDLAAADFTRSLELAPAKEITHDYLAQVYLAQSRPQDALAEEMKEKQVALRLCGLALAYHTLGKNKESDQSLAELKTKFSKSAPYQIAAIYAFRGDVDLAFEWLDRAYQDRDTGMAQIKGDPLLKNLKRDPRYAAWLTRMHLP